MSDISNELKPIESPMVKSALIASVSIILVCSAASVASATELQISKAKLPLGSFEVAQACGHYIVLGCYKKHRSAKRRLNSLGGPGVGGGAGTNVVHTNDYPNFRNGWYCVADGPYNSRRQAESIAWKEAVRDAYVKSGC